MQPNGTRAAKFPLCFADQHHSTDHRLKRICDWFRPRWICLAVLPTVQPNGFGMRLLPRNEDLLNQFLNHDLVGKISTPITIGISPFGLIVEYAYNIVSFVFRHSYILYLNMTDEHR